MANAIESHQLYVEIAKARRQASGGTWLIKSVLGAATAVVSSELLVGESSAR